MNTTGASRGGDRQILQVIARIGYGIISGGCREAPRGLCAIGCYYEILSPSSHRV